MNLRLIVVIGAVLSIMAIGLSQPGARKGPAFTKDGKLVLPTGFREWVFVGGPITPNGPNQGKAQFPEFHSVYIEPENLRSYQKHANFPDGTVIVKELALTQPGKYPDGSFRLSFGPRLFPELPARPRRYGERQ